MFAAAPELKVVARLGVGYDQVDVAAATRHGVAVAMAFGTNHEAVADHAMALMAAAAHRIVEYDRRRARGRLGQQLHARLHETTVGIVGFGRIGRALAKRCLGFNMEVLVADPVAEADTVARLGYRLVELDELLRAGRLRLAPRAAHRRDPPSDRRRAAGADEAPAFLINTARGGLVDEAALIGALRAGQIAGAGLDVFEVEPLPDTPLRHLEQVVLTPARGRPQRRIAARHGRTLVENMLACCAAATRARASCSIRRCCRRRPERRAGGRFDRPRRMVLTGALPLGPPNLPKPSRRRAHGRPAIIDRDGTKRPVQLHGPEAFAAMRRPGGSRRRRSTSSPRWCAPASPRASSTD